MTSLGETRHYPTLASRRADFLIHIVALVSAIVGAGVGLALAMVHRAKGGEMVAIAIYGLGLVATFSFSTVYNFAQAKRQPFLRRLDHAGVLLMIASSYTPFTTQALTGGWAIGMTAAVWGLASIGISCKLLLPDLGKIYWIGFYLALGWIGVVAGGPLMHVLPANALALLVAGGIAYSVGTIFYAQKRLLFRRAIWHAHVLAGAALQYLAILFGIILKGIPG